MYLFALKINECIFHSSYATEIKIAKKLGFPIGFPYFSSLPYLQSKHEIGKDFEDSVMRFVATI